MGRALRAREAATLLFVDVTFPAPRLIIFGAVDFAAALCPLARATGWRPVRRRPARAFFARPTRFPDAEEVVAAWPEEAFARIGGIDRATVDRRAHARPEARRRGARASRCAPRPPTSARWARAARRRSAASGCSPPGITDEELARICARRSASTSAR